MGQWKRVLWFLSLGVILSGVISLAEQPGFGFPQGQQRPPVPKGFFQTPQGQQQPVLARIEDIGTDLEAIESASSALINEFTITRQQFPLLSEAMLGPYFSPTAGEENLRIGSLLSPFMKGNARLLEHVEVPQVFQEVSQVLQRKVLWPGPENRAFIPYSTILYWIGRLKLEAKTLRCMHADLLGMMQNGAGALPLPDGRILTADQLFSRMQYRYQQLTSSYINAVAISVFYIHVLEQDYFVGRDRLTVEGDPIWQSPDGRLIHLRRYQKGPRLACPCYRGGGGPIHPVCPTLAAQLTRFRGSVLGVMERFHEIHHNQEFYGALQIAPGAACFECLFEDLTLLVSENPVSPHFLPLVFFDFRKNAFAGLIPGKGWSEQLTAYQNKIQRRVREPMFSAASSQSIFGESVGQGPALPFPVGPLPQGLIPEQPGLSASGIPGGPRVGGPGSPAIPTAPGRPMSPEDVLRQRYQQAPGGPPGQRPDPNAEPSGNPQGASQRPTERPL